MPCYQETLWRKFSAPPAIQVDAGNTATYVYDADSRRVQKTSTVGNFSDPAGTWIFFYDQAGRMVQEFNSPGNTFVRGNIYAGGRHLASVGGGTYFTHSDWLGTERVRNAFSSPTFLETCTCLPFGDGLTCQGMGDVSPLHFTGKERDAATGLDYFGARFDASSMGRFMSPDPASTGTELDEAKSPQSLNAYSYVQNNPPNAVDPDGLDCVYVSDNRAFFNSGNCVPGMNGTYVNGTIDPKSGAYDPTTGTVTFSYTNKDTGTIGRGVLGNAFPSDGVSDAAKLNALALAGRRAEPGVSLAAIGLRTFGYIVAAPLMAIAECAAEGKDCSAGGTALAILPLGGDWEAINALRPLSAMGHAAKHLEEFKKIDPTLTEEAVAKILTYVKEAYPGVAQKSGKVMHEGEVLIKGQKVTVRVVETSSGNIKSGFPVL